MISTIHIQGYRGLEDFEMGSLGRLNLLVGTNNSGKTSVLEAVNLLMSRGDPASLWQLLWRRGERQSLPVSGPERARRPQWELDVSHLFFGHEAHTGSRFTISSRNQTPEASVVFTVTELSPKERAEIFGADDEGALPSRLALQIKGHPKPPVSLVPLSRTGGISADAVEATPRRVRRRATEEYPLVFVTAESLTVDELIGLWDRVSLTPAEGLVLRALQFIDRDVERIAAQAATPPYYTFPSRGGFIVKRKNFDQPIPIGTMGDGMWRMLAMAIAITQCRGGVLLVDEIDTGLHYSVMAEMWRLIFRAAKEFDVQLFATTHSYDCVYSLAQISGEADSRNPVTVQRIESGRGKATPYTDSEIRVAADREIEVR